VTQQRDRKKNDKKIKKNLGDPGHSRRDPSEADHRRYQRNNEENHGPAQHSDPFRLPAAYNAQAVGWKRKLEGRKKMVAGGGQAGHTAESVFWITGFYGEERVEMR